MTSAPDIGRSARGEIQPAVLKGIPPLTGWSKSMNWPALLVRFADRSWGRDRSALRRLCFKGSGRCRSLLLTLLFLAIGLDRCSDFVASVFCRLEAADFDNLTGVRKLLVDAEERLQAVLFQLWKI